MSSFFEVTREPRHAELELSNAITAISETAIILQQNLPKNRTERAIWEHQRTKLKMALGLCGNVRRMIDRDVAFESLRRGARS